MVQNSSRKNRFQKLARVRIVSHMTEPTYTPVTSYEEEEALREIIEALRADNGKLLRELKTLGRSDKDYHRQFAELLVHHPNLRDLVAH